MLGVIGDVVQDVIVWQLEETREATDIKSEVRMRRGGSAANVAAFAAPRYPTRFIGCVGDDSAGASLRQELEGRGVDVRFQLHDHTGMIVVLIDQDGERAMYPSRGACNHLETLDPSWLDDLEIPARHRLFVRRRVHCQDRARRGPGTEGTGREGIDGRLLRGHDRPLRSSGVPGPIGRMQPGLHLREPRRGPLSRSGRR